MREIYDGMYSSAKNGSGVPQPPQTVEAMLDFPTRNPTAYRWMEQPFAALLDHFVADPKLKSLLTTLTGYLSDRPQELSVAAMAPIFGYYFHGGFYPKGGSQRLADVLVEAVRENGGTVLLKKPVSRILTADGAVTGIELQNGAIHRAAAVIAAGDLRRTLEQLLAPEDLPPQYRGAYTSLPASTSAFSVHLGLDMVPDLGRSPSSEMAGDWASESPFPRKRTPIWRPKVTAPSSCWPSCRNRRQRLGIATIPHTAHAKRPRATI